MRWHPANTPGEHPDACRSAKMLLKGLGSPDTRLKSFLGTGSFYWRAVNYFKKHSSAQVSIAPTATLLRSSPPLVHWAHDFGQVLYFLQRLSSNRPSLTHPTCGPFPWVKVPSGAYSLGPMGMGSKSIKQDFIFWSSWISSFQGP